MTSKDHDLTQQASEPIQLYQFGPHFRHWREKRGYSLKEAASDIISVSHLSQFEKGTKTLTLPKFSDLLMNIGVDIIVFFLSYPGQHVEQYEKLGTTNNLERVPDYYRNFPNLLEILEYVINAVKYTGLLISDPPQPPRKELVEKVIKQEEPNLAESEFLLVLLTTQHLPQDLVTPTYQHLSALILDKLTPTSVVHLTQTDRMLQLATYLCQSMSRQGYHKETLDFIKQIKRRLEAVDPKFSLPHNHQLLLIEMFKVYTLIRMGRKTEAFELRVKITKTWDALIEGTILDSQVRLLLHLRTQFNESCQNLLDGRIK